MTKINQKEYDILKGLDDKWKWITRDEDNPESTFQNQLWLHELKPTRNYEMWLGGGRATEKLGHEELFEFIQWKNKEPYNIAELIEEYEGNLIKVTPWTPNPLDFEREETEVKKDKKWLLERVDNYIPPHDKTVGQVVANILDIIRQLDEPEILSQEWIDENKEMYLINDTSKNAVPTHKLQRLLVPKQEELETKIQELIEVYKQEDGAYSNPENGWIGGFIEDLKSLLEEEQKYYICLPNMSGENEIYIWYEGRTNNYYTTSNKTIREVAGNKIQFTEQEIKAIDKRFWAFAEPVEEEEE